MKKIFLKIFFLIFCEIILFAIILFLPPTKSFRKSLFYSLYDKNKLLKETLSPRIIFIGGSNLSFGINSKMIKDSLNINPINTGLHASMGLKYMLANSIDYIKEGDIIVVSPEYQQFYNRYANGEIELLSILVDVAPHSIKLLDYKQYFHLIRFVPGLCYSKCFNSVKGEKEDTTVGLYDRKSFNSFGDAYKHWTLSKENVTPFSGIKGNIDDDVLSSLINFRNLVYKKKAKLYIAFPCFQDLSYNKSLTKIKDVEIKLKKNSFVLLGTPERYKMNDSLIYNQPYHLTKKGTDYRTALLIEDLKSALKP